MSLSDVIYVDDPNKNEFKEIIESSGSLGELINKKRCCAMCKKTSKNKMIRATHFNDDLKNYNCNILTPNEPIIYFCDLLCARLYDINIHKINIDFYEHRAAFLNGELSKTSTLIYKKYKNKLFTQIIYQKVNNISNLNRKEIESIKKKIPI